MRVAEVMTIDVVSIGLRTPLKDAAELLAAHGFTGVPVVDSDGAVVGVVSEADVLAKERGPRRRRPFRSQSDALKARARTAAEAMSTPAVTVGPDARVEDVARLMLDRGVKRLPVVDASGCLLGIVTRTDLVRAFVRGDNEIAQEIREEVLLKDLWLDPAAFDVTVERGDVRIAGTVGSSDERTLLERHVRLVPGVVDVELDVTAAYTGS
jgi:CBS domain-containing protein